MCFSVYIILHTASYLSESNSSALVSMTSLTANSNPTLAAIGLMESDTEPANVAIGSISRELYYILSIRKTKFVIVKFSIAC